MAHEHRSGLSDAYDRIAERPHHARLVFRENRLGQAAELNELQSIAEARGQRIGNLIGRDGDRVEGAEIVVDAQAGIVTLTAGRVYLRGDVRAVSEAVLAGVPMAGDVRIGVRYRVSVVTEVEDPELTGLAPGTDAEGEPGAAREVESVVWGFEGDGLAGELYGVYLLRDGVAIDQTPPPNLSGVNAAIAQYDRDANGNYIVEGCRVTALGKVGGDRIFAISEGVANIMGFKRTRHVALRHAEPEAFDAGVVDAEPHTFADGGSGTVTIPLSHTPVASILNAIVTKEVTESVVHGAVSGASDELGNTSVTEIVSVTQGGTTYAEGADYTLNADRVDWSAGGDEPAPGSSYDVTYRYLDAVVPDTFDDDTVTLSGGVTGATVLVSYEWKLPRVDLLCLDQDGNAVYLKGVSARSRPTAPVAPVTLLPLAEISNGWRGKPAVANTGVRSVHYDVLWRYLNRLVDALDLIALERLRRDIDSREPVAKKGVFVDPFTSDRYRDAGEAQSAAVFSGAMQLAVDPTFYAPPLAAPVTLDWTEEVVIAQELATACQKINPYANFTPLPAGLALDPAADFWVEHETEWTSPVSRQFGSGSRTRTTTRDELVDEREELLEFLREIDVGFQISGFGPGEELDSLTFDGIDVTPAGPLAADAQGEIAGSFAIPANVTAGQKLVRAEGAGGAFAEAAFVGQGVVEIDVMRRVTTTRRSQPSRSTRRSMSGETGGGGAGADPIAQTFILPEPRHVAGVDLKFCLIGDTANGVLVQLVTVENGIPTTEVIAEAFVNMATVVLDQWTAIRFPLPVFLPADREYAFVVKTDDADHSIAIGRVGDFDAEAQEWVSAQPYSVGVMLSSSNARTWTPHQAEDVTFRLVAAAFAPATKVVDLGQHDLVDASDLMARATVELPTAEARMQFEIERADGSVTRLEPGQVWELDQYITETVALRAVLTGTATISPILYPGVLLVAGKIRTEGSYVSRAFAMGTGIRLASYLKALLPAGSGLTVEVDAGDGNWQAVPSGGSTLIEDGWTEREYELNPHSAQEGRLRLTLTGGPAARPAVADLRAVSI
ncbi:DUF4815 domain-containing protein [Kaustia mangrovi]|uniref:DUF4815 domain-containing protein n=1 Tax=Kaustia mangrovi TaxID=2593653 RepID=A0A7S8HDD3_9HYPH|nr:DUF4815 domain-containing protein [Kaustia mangrovi]QPC44520.1 DUF4815 domain-containing protein [Kaustia mangrovi]